MSFKDILKAVLGVLLPIAFGLIIARNPDFPLNEDQFVSTILYIIGGAFGGWAVLKYKVQSVTGKTLAQVLRKAA